MLDFVESLLARWTGRAKWPTTKATLESRLQMQGPSIATRTAGNPTDTADIFSYEVDGRVFVAAIHEIAGRKDISGSIGHTVRIRYNPNRPSQIYYAPARQLMGRAYVVVVLVAGVLAITLAIHLHG